MDVESQQQAFEEFETVVDTFLSGSYSRKVQVLKLNDVDVIVTLDDPEGSYASSAEAALEGIRSAAKESDLVRRTKLGVRAAKLFLHDHEFTVDLVAAMEPEDGADGLLLARHLPEEGYDDWQLLNPEGQREAAADKNDDCDGVYVPGVRLVKFWNQGEGKPLRSYHAESILWHALNGPVEYPELIVRFFDEAYKRLAPGATTPDPGAPAADPVDKRLEATERATARDKVEQARRIAHDAFGKEDLEEALERWADLFGPSFPSQSTTPGG